MRNAMVPQLGPDNRLLAAIAGAPVRAGTNPETSRRDTFRAGEALAPVIAVTLDSHVRPELHGWGASTAGRTSRSR